jgi:branched-chain amino acid transport system ATP-binding protein
MFLELEGVEAYYGLSHVLQGVSLTVSPHEVVGLFGRNGVGKTTILRTIAGWLKPRSGTIRFEGEDIGGHQPDQIALMGVGFVPEDRRIFPGLTVEENLRLGLRIGANKGKNDARQSLERIYQRFPRLAERRTQLGTTLSGGEQQMLAIARVLMGRPRLLLIDEPTEGLAPMIVDEIFHLISELRDEGIPIVLVEQNVTRALNAVDRFYAVDRGRISLVGSSSVAEERELLFQAIAV